MLHSSFFVTRSQVQGSLLRWTYSSSPLFVETSRPHSEVTNQEMQQAVRGISKSSAYLMTTCADAPAVAGSNAHRHVQTRHCWWWPPLALHELAAAQHDRRIRCLLQTLHIAQYSPTTMACAHYWQQGMHKDGLANVSFLECHCLRASMRGFGSRHLSMSSPARCCLESAGKWRAKCPVIQKRPALLQQEVLLHFFSIASGHGCAVQVL
mmetsp:Transcript_75707/g.122920  ORF Transcript_75707/g.122920 Transcript_75707/m.122920 type:complete len:209 (+) Transcript_75707:1049-1675(+)